MVHRLAPIRFCISLYPKNYVVLNLLFITCLCKPIWPYHRYIIIRHFKIHCCPLSFCALLQVGYALVTFQPGLFTYNYTQIILWHGQLKVVPDIDNKLTWLKCILNYSSQYYPNEIIMNGRLSCNQNKLWGRSLNYCYIT